jgi:2'-5' RNA ligase
MYYALSFYPHLNEELAESIDAIRRKHDPTFGLTKPHITVLFPIPDSVGESDLISHIESVLNDFSPFKIRLGGFHKSRDHWLFLKLADGEVHVRKLYQSLYTGILEEYRRDDIEYVPHLGLGLFVKEGSNYDWRNPREIDFDEERYEEALQQAMALLLDSIFKVDKLELTKISDEILGWATGKRASIPEDSQIVTVREFLLGDQRRSRLY